MTSAGSHSGRLAYQPALDGLRAVALLGVVAYHAGLDIMGGGFLGVSTFFTLSGFLITSLLLTERQATAGVDLGSFWSRRIRRLLPAALVTIVATLLLTAMVGDDSQLDRLRLDSLSSLLHFSNWRFIAGGDSYGALFESPSFFRHFWSLAVEEQYYLVFPLLMAGTLGALRGPGRAFAVALTSLAILTMVWPTILFDRGASVDRLYFGTDTRMGELVLGAVLALWWVRRGQRVPDRPVPLTAATIASLAVLAPMWSRAHPSDAALYRGGLVVHAALTLVIIVAAIAPRGPVRTVLGWEPLRWLGTISYGAYLFHWPILLVLQQETSLGPEARFLLGTAVTIVLAAASHRFIEQPIRRRGSSGVPGRRLWVALPATGTVAALIFVVTAWQTPSRPPIDFAGAADELTELTTDPPPPPETTDADADTADPAPGPAASRPVRISGFGDSTALMTGLGIAQWAAEHPGEATMIEGKAQLGCGLATGGVRRLEGREIPVPEACDPWLGDWIDSISGDEVDVSLVQLGAWDIVDHQLNPGEPFLAISEDAEYEALLRTRLDEAIAALLEVSDVVMLLAHPDVGQARLDGVPTGAEYPEYDPARSIRMRELIAEAAAENPDAIVVDLADWVHDHPDDRWLRPDGVHFSYESTRAVAEWLTPEVLRRYELWRTQSADA